HVERSGLKSVHSLHRSTCVDLTTNTVETGEQLFAIFHLDVAHGARQPEILQTRSIGRKRSMSHSQKTGLCARLHPSQADERRNVHRLRTAKFRDDRTESRVMSSAVFPFIIAGVGV